MTRHLVVIRHSLFRPRITDEDVEEALPPDQRCSPRTVIDIEPDELRELHEYGHAYPWQRAAERQAQLFNERLLPALKQHAGANVAYFGMAPIPLAFALGTLVTERERVEIYQRHHGRNDFRWMAPEPALLSDFDRPLVEPDPRWEGELIVRVSSSHRIDPDDTDVLFADRGIPTRSFDHAVKDTDEDIFETRAGLEHFCRGFDELLDTLERGYRRCSRIHIFAAVPCGVAFRLGTYCNPNVRPPILTYKYKPDCEPRYAPAIAIGVARGKAKLLLLTADPHDLPATSGASELAAVHDLAQQHRARLSIEIETEFKASDLRKVLDTDARILHFAGHGVGAGGPGARSRELELIADAPHQRALLLMGTDGRRLTLAHDDLIKRLAAGLPRGLRCVVLTACHSASLAKRLVRETPVDHAIGFHGPIDDDAARIFSIALYSNLLEGRDIAESVEFAGQAIEHEGLEGRDQICFQTRARADLTALLPPLP